jgi:hypothetical protein
MTKQEIVIGKPQGVYENLVIVPQTTKSEQKFDEIVQALKDGKQFLMREGYTRNSVYVLLKKLDEEAKVKASFGVTQTGVYPKGTMDSKKKDISGQPINQYVLFPMKKEEAKKE